MPQYPIPQFIEEEGKIISFLTFRQFFLIVGGGAICVLLFYLTPFLVFVFTALPIALLTAAIAFVKIENETIVQILLHMIGFSMTKKNYVWKKGDASYSAAALEPPGLANMHVIK